MKRIIIAAAPVFVLAVTASAPAQEINLATANTTRPSIVHARVGIDHGLVGEIGYRHVLVSKHPQVFVGGDIAFPWASPDIFDYRVRATVGVSFGKQHFKFAGWLSPTVRGNENAAATMTALGVDLRLLGGYYAQRWFAAGELGIDWAATTHITLSDAYRASVYSGAKDGFYGMTGGSVYAGLQGGLSFSSVDVVLRAGHPRTTAFAGQSIPFYLLAGVNVTLPQWHSGRPSNNAAMRR